MRHLLRPLLLIALLALLPLVVIIPTLHSADPALKLFAWRERADAPIDRVEGIGAHVDDKLYVLSGFRNADLAIATEIDVYDLNSDTWTADIGRMPGAGVTHINPAVDGTDIWIAGGFAGDHPGPPVAEVWRYDTRANVWNAEPPLPEARAGGSLVLHDGVLHYIGGFAFRDRPDALDNTRTTHWALDLTDRAAGWRPLAPLPEPLGHLSGIALDGRIYAIGGQIRHDRDPVDLAAVYAYDVATDRWQRRADLPEPRSHAEPGTLAFNGRIVVVGGRDNTMTSGFYNLNSVILYDPERDVWIDLPQLPFTRIAPIAALQNGELFVTHGGAAWNRPQRITISGLLAESWETEHPDMPLAASGAAGAIIGRRMFVIGADAPATLAFDLSRGAWEAADAHPAPPLATTGAAVEAFADRLYVFGGIDAAATALQIYDPATRLWRSGAPLPFAATHGAAVAIGAFIYLVADDQAARYDPAADAWEMLTAGPPTAVQGAAAGAAGAHLYLFGGATEAGPTALVQRYDTQSATWQTSAMPGTNLTALPAPRLNAGRAICRGGAFYLLGGRDGAGAPLPNGAVYTLATAAWHALPAAPTPRFAAAVAAIADRIYVAGGMSSGALASLEVYNIASPNMSATVCGNQAPTPTPTPQPNEPTEQAIFAPLITR